MADLRKRLPSGMLALSSLLLPVICAFIPVQVSLATEVVARFAVLQSSGLGLSPGDEFSVSLAINPGATGVEVRGMGGGAETGYSQAISRVSIATDSKKLEFPGNFDVLVMPLRNQWAAGLSPRSKQKGPADSLTGFTLTLTYEKPDLLPAGPVPPLGAIPASKANSTRMGIDLMAQGRLESNQSWSVVGGLIEMSLTE